jgi:Zn-dependent protease
MKNGQWLAWRWNQVPVFFHWSVLLWVPWYSLQVQRPVAVALATLATLVILVAHEIGHALVARLTNTPVYAIRVHFLQGQCEHAQPRRELEDACIAWGGVLAQLALLLATLLLRPLIQAASPQVHDFLVPAFNTLVYANLLWMAFNLLPIASFDGQRAWRLIPLLRGTSRSEPRGALRAPHWRRWRFFSFGKRRQQRDARKNADTVTYELLERLRRQRDKNDSEGR